MINLRQMLSCVLVGIYGALAGTLLGWVATFWMFGLGFIVGLPLGLICGAICGYKMWLRDAVILLAGCFSGLVLVKWLRLALGWSSPVETVILLTVVASSGPLCWVIQQRLAPLTRFRLALFLVANAALNLAMFIGIRA